MATLSVAIKSALTGAVAWTTLVTGSTYLLDDLGVNGLTPDKLTYDANGRMRLTAVINWSAGTPAEIVHRTYRRFFYVRLFGDPVNGFVNIRAAQRLLQLPNYDGGVLHRARVVSDTEGHALIAFVNVGTEYYDEELNGACASFSRLVAEYRQR